MFLSLLADVQCPKDFVRCAHGHCLDAKLVCDGHNDCGDNSDEQDCDKRKAHDIKCVQDDSNGEPTKYQCQSDKTICLDITARCNGTAECPRGEDEADCPGCRISDFECDDGECIRHEWRCDGEHDCKDKSDEKDCSGKTSNSTIPSMGGSCDDHLFDCNDGHCVEMENVCNGHADCPNKADENGKCATACGAVNPCAQTCTKSPHGPICGCSEGYRLDGDRTQCKDIDECTEYGPCAQTCENTAGSFRCSCFVDYMLRSDKISCKSVGDPKYMIYSAGNVMWKIVPFLSTIWTVNASKVVGMDVNIKKNLLYFTSQYVDAIMEFDLKTNSINSVRNVGNPTKVAVDWGTDNVYFIDASSSPSIKVCHMSDKACVRLVSFKYRDIVTGLSADAVNKYIFGSVLHYMVYNSPNTVIYRYNLDGTHAQIVVRDAAHVSALTCDANKKLLYYTELISDSVWSVNYDGTAKRSVVKSSEFIRKPTSVNVFEDQVFVTNTGTQNVAQCKLYGDRQCKAFQLNVYNAENLLVVQASRQKTVENVCDRNNCSLLCVPADRGAKCLCHDGVYVGMGSECNDVSYTFVLSFMFK